MSDPIGRFRRFLAELKRRKVYRTAVVYAVVAFAVWQVADFLFPALGFPAWTVDFVVVVSLLGFPLALVLAWAFEMTPEGVRRTETPKPVGSGGGGAYQWVGLAVVALLSGGIWYATTGDGGEPAAENTTTRDTGAARAASMSRDTAGPPRIAVLPFENIAPDSSDDFFADGMHEEVLNQLAKVSGLEVISRTSVMGYADTDKRVPEISRELGGVDALLEGTVRRAGDQVRITTQLINAPDDAHLWSDTYDRALSVDAIFDIQADIAEQIAGALETQLAEGERQRIAEVPTSNLAAYEAFLQGRNQVERYWGEAQPSLLVSATEHLQRTVRLDSTFAEAYAWLGIAYTLRRGHEYDRRSHLLDSAKVAVQQARRLDSELATVHFAQAWLYRVQGSPDAEMQAYRRALELQPSHALAKEALSGSLAAEGDFVEGVRVAHEAVRLDPRNPLILVEMADQLRGLGFYDAAEAWYRHVLQTEPSYFGATGGEWQLHHFRGDPEQALEVMEGFIEQAGSPPPISFHLAAESALATSQPEEARAYLERLGERVSEAPREARSRPSFGGTGEVLSRRLAYGLIGRALVGLTELRVGNEERGREILQQVTESEPRSRMDQFALAGIRGTLGETDEALSELERLVQEAPDLRSWIRWHPFFDPLRSEPRFQQILGQIDANQQRIQEEVRQMDIELYPPGTAP